MSALFIKNLPEHLHRQLKLQAQRNHRSLTKEAIRILEAGLTTSAPAVEPLPPPFKLGSGRTPTVEEVEDAIAEGCESLPDPLLRRAEAAAARQGRRLRDLVAEAIEAKLGAEEGARSAAESSNAWKAFRARLQKMPDGSYYNPEGVEDERFFETLEEIRQERSAWQPRDPFAATEPGASRRATRPPARAASRRRKPKAA